MDKEFVLCQCRSMEHQIAFISLEDEPDTVYTQVHLVTHRGFFERFVAGIRYILGYKSKYGDWDEFIMSREELIKALTPKT